MNIVSPVNPDIFKAYDIRGVYGVDIDEVVVEKIGRAYAKLLKAESNQDSLSVVVSRDMRLSSPQLSQALIKGLVESGVNVIDIGLASTPTFYFGVGYLQADGGIQVSASHNPAEWNGLKIVRAKGVPVSGDTGMYTLRDMVLADDFESASVSGQVTTNDEVLEASVREQIKHRDVSGIKPFKIVADPANSMGALYLDALFRHLSACELIRVNFELDGTFPSHEADPLKDENLDLLKTEVLKHEADFGIATDGDGDRVFLVTNEGQTLAPEILRGILAQVVLEENPGAKIGYDIRPGKITQDMIEEAGGIPFVTRVGHSLIKEKMIEENSPFSGESSGHFFYKSEYGSYEMPVRMLVDFMFWLSQRDTSLSELAKPLQRYYHSGEINSAVESAEKVFSRLRDAFSDCPSVSDLDGLTFEYPDFWFNVRASNTEPKVRLNLEAISEEIMKRETQRVLALIRQA